MNNNWTIYMHINKINGKKYIGITSQNPKERWGSNGQKYKSSKLFYNAIKKYGWNNFLHEIIFENISEEDATYLEDLLIKSFNTKKPNGYNLADGGWGSSGVVLSDDTKEKISNASKARWNDEEYKQKMINIRNNPNGIYQSEEFKNKISALVSGENNPNFNHKWSEEKKKQLSEKQKLNPIYYYDKNPNAKKIRCIETGEIFNCMKFAQEKYGLKSTGSFTTAIKKHKTAVGYHWEYV